MSEAVIEKLFLQYQQKGFLTNDEIFAELVSSNVSIIQTERICSELLSKGVLISDSLSLNASSDEKPNFDYDKSHINYDELYDKIIQKVPNLKFLVDYIRKIQPPHLHEVEKLYPQIKSGNKFARNRLFEMNMRMALKLAYQKSREFNLSLEDTVQDAMIGLNCAIDKFDLSKHDKFQGYATFWILNYINRNKRNDEMLWDIPAHLKEKFDKIYKYLKEVHPEFWNETFIKEDLISDVSKFLGIKQIKVIKYLYFLQPCIDYDDLEKKSVFLDINGILQENSFEDNKIDEIIEKVLEEHVKDVLLTLPAREQDVLKMRYGFNENNPLTLDEVGKYFGVTRERIRQIEAKALKRLRHHRRASGLRDYMDS